MRHITATSKRGEGRGRQNYGAKYPCVCRGKMVEWKLIINDNVPGLECFENCKIMIRLPVQAIAQQSNTAS